MNRLAVALIGMAALAVGCQSSGRQVDRKTQRQLSAQNAPSVEWKLRFSTRCGRAPAEQCVAAYGFTVLADGRFSVGPAPAGQTLEGPVAEADFNPLAEDVKTILSSVSASVGEFTCEKGPKPQDGEESISLNVRGREIELIHLSEVNGLCYRNGTGEQAERVRQSLRALAQRHYPTPFPDTCLDAARAAESLYVGLGACQADEDCAYVDRNFTPIRRDELQYVGTSDCSVVARLAVGNAERVRGAQDRLQEARSRAREVCGPRFERAGCTQGTGFQAHWAPPVCESGVCRVHPSLRAN